MNLRITAFDDSAVTAPEPARRNRRRRGRPPLERTAGARGVAAGRTPPPPRVHRKQPR